MAFNTTIGWTDRTWTPVKGCTRVSEGCRNCYAEIMTARFSKPGQWGEGLAEIVTTPQGKDHRWTGSIRCDSAELLKPLGWHKPAKVFVCSTSDLFHEGVPDSFIDQIFSVMAACPHLTFQVLTKRPERLREYAARAMGCGEHWLADCERSHAPMWPLDNVWIGTSVEDQAAADERIPHLLATPAAVRWISAEPLLGPIDLKGWIYAAFDGDRRLGRTAPYIHWVVVGGESGPGARPMHPDWVRLLRQQCATAGCAFNFKQWGNWAPTTLGFPAYWVSMDGKLSNAWNALPAPTDASIFRLSKKLAGRTLDGKIHDEYPQIAGARA